MRVRILRSCRQHGAPRLDDVPKVSLSRPVAVQPNTAFHVAADVGSYIHFVPLMQRSQVRGVKTRDGDKETFRAELVVSYLPLNLKESFVSDVTVDHHALTVEARSVDGPFKAVRTRWTIQPTGDYCMVTVDIDYTLKSPFMQMAVGGLMPMATDKLLQAFEQRALQMAKSV
jgi:coenzyme Q-binding protein COQ10